MEVCWPAALYVYEVTADGPPVSTGGCVADNSGLIGLRENIAVGVVLVTLCCGVPTAYITLDCRPCES
jgi:hypothetical protein